VLDLYQVAGKTNLGSDEYVISADEKTSIQPGCAFTPRSPLNPARRCALS